MKKKQLLGKAISLRQEGWAVPKIAKELALSKATVFSWVKHVTLTDEQKRRLRTRDGSRTGGAKRSATYRAKRLASQERGRQEIQRDCYEHVAGCMLYWGEGSKRRTSLGLTNCDVRLISLFVRFLKKFYDVTNQDIALRFQYHEGGKTPEEIFHYWIKTLDIEGCRCTKPYCKQKRSSETKYPYGVCSINVHSMDIVNRVWGSIQEYAGFSDPDYLT